VGVRPRDAVFGAARVFFGCTDFDLFGSNVGPFAAIRCRCAALVAATLSDDIAFFSGAGLCGFTGAGLDDGVFSFPGGFRC